MQIYNYNNLPYINHKTVNYSNTSTFRGVKTLQTCNINAGEKLEYGIRLIGNKFHDIMQPKSSKMITKNIAALTSERNRAFLEQLAEIGRLYSSQKTIDVNIEDQILEQIAKKGDSTIFIMNHSNQAEDPQMLAVLNTLLAEAYKKEGCDTFPLPKIIMNEDILKTMNPTRRKAFENFGAIGIDASVIGGDKGGNARVFLPLIKGFVRNECNIFIFPEGRLAIRKDLDLYGRFQGGVASLINKILGIKKEVTVVPVSFAYGSGEQKGLNAMNIGTPITVKRKGEATTITSGDISKNPESSLYNFFEKRKNQTDITITSGGVPVPQSEVSDYLKTILCENLEINGNIAQKKLEIPLDECDIEFC